jgi:CubicO group peptidase (beta-lactamase class C family)
VAGRCDPRFRAVADAFAANFAEGLEVGAACAVALDGALVVDLWDGVVRRGGQPWAADTLVETRSATKGVTALCLHVLIDRGLVDLDAPMRRYWPELRSDPLVRHVLAHSAGIPVIDQPLPPGALVDWEAMAQAVAAQEPLWEPGEKVGYHGVTFGWLVGEVVRRVSGMTIGTFVQREIAPLAGGDYFIGTPSTEHHRIAPMVASPAARATAGTPAPANAHDLAARMMAPVFPPISPPWNSPEFWSAEVPVANGICTARALATIYGTLAQGGGALVGAHAVRAMAEPVFDGIDEVQGLPVRRTLGFELAPPWEQAGRPDGAFGHPGAGGFVAFADPDAGVGFAYVKNAGSPTPGQPDPRGPRLVRALYDTLA